MTSFEVIKKDKSSWARIGVLHTAHGDVMTPVFLPVGTKGTVKSVRNDELRNWGVEMILANTYHLWMQPSDKLIKKAGGLHRFMGWKEPIFTDSGGFQIFSLGEKTRRRIGPEEQKPLSIEVKESGVSFQAGSSGEKKELTPELSIQIQTNFGSDVALVLDEFPGYPFECEKAKSAAERTTRWAKRAKEEFLHLKKRKQINPGQILLGIIQGASFPDLRKKSAKEIRALDFDGYAIGGVAVGEPAEEMYKAVNDCIPFLEEDKFRHLLGVGTPENIVQAVARGCDSFDCVIPTREARHGKAYTLKRNGYKTADIASSKFKEDFSPLDPNCQCFACQHHTKAYLNHLFKSRENLAVRLLTEHNLRFYLELMAKMRRAILEQKFSAMAENYKDLTSDRKKGKVFDHSAQTVAAQGLVINPSLFEESVKAQNKGSQLLTGNTGLLKISFRLYIYSHWSLPFKRSALKLIEKRNFVKRPSKPRCLSIGAWRGGGDCIFLAIAKKMQSPIKSYPFTTAIGLKRATFLAMPA